MKPRQDDQKLQFLKKPLEAGSKSEEIHTEKIQKQNKKTKTKIHTHTNTIHIGTKKCFGLYG